MARSIRFHICFPLCLIPSLVGCGNNTEFAITEFKVVKNGSVLVEDRFNGAPLSLADVTPDQKASYQLLGQFGVPKDNRQVLSYEQAVISPTNSELMSNTATLETSIDSVTRLSGLRSGTAFEITGTFDMIVPEKIGQGYFIGLSDGLAGSDNTSKVLAKDSIVLGYRQVRIGTPLNVVFFRSTDYTKPAEGTVTNQTYAFLTPSDGQKLKLRLSKVNAAENRVTASYALVNNGVVGPYVELSQTMQGAGHMPIFREHDYTRPMFGAFWPRNSDSPEAGKAVPKPQSATSTSQLSGTMPNSREELIEFQTRGTRAKALLTYEVGKKPEFVALMIPGDSGNFGFESTPSGISMIKGARLQNRLRSLLLQRGIASVLLDAPGDNPEMQIFFRESAEHLSDLQAAVAVIEKRFPTVPVVVIGHNFGTWSATFLTAALPEKINATVLIGPALTGGEVLNEHDRFKRIGEGLSAYHWDKVQRPLLLMHHKKDDCYASPYSATLKLSQQSTRLKLLSIDSENDTATSYCGLTGPNNLDGHEILVADSIAKWVAQQPRHGK